MPEPAQTLNNKNLRKVLIAGSSVIFYIAGLVIGLPIVGNIAQAAIAVPILTFPAVFGMKTGVVSGSLAFVINFIFVYLTSGATFNDIYYQPIVGGIGMILVSYVIGYFTDSTKKIIQLKEHTLALHLGIERSNDVIFITDENGILQYVNPSFTNTYGYTQDEWKGKTPRLLKSGKQTSEFYARFWDTITSKKPVNIEMINKKKDGTLIIISNSVNPIANEKGELIGFLAIQRDITDQKNVMHELVRQKEELENAKKELEERRDTLLKVLEDEKNLEQNLKEERDRINLIISSMGEGLLVIGPDYKVNLVNPAASKILGLTEGEIIGKSWSELAKAYEGTVEIPLEKRVSVQVLKKAVTIITDLDANHYYYVESSGRKFPIVSMTTPLIIDGEVKGAIKIFRDASEEKEAEIIIQAKLRSGSHALKEEQVKSQAILENTGEAVILTDSKGMVTYVNPSFENTFGYKSDEFIGRDYSDTIKAFDKESKPISPAHLSDTAAVTAKNRETKLKIQSKSGRLIDASINASPVTVEGSFAGVVRIIHDITEEVSLQQQKDDFFSIASHELRTPLTIISGNLDTIQAGYGKSHLSEVDLQLLQDTQTSAERLTKLVSDFLNVSRLDQARLKFKMEKVDANFITKQIIHELESLAKNKGLYIKAENIEDPKNQFIAADEGLFKEILINLIGNSIKFTGEGGITVRNTIDGKMLRVDVSDTGMGIAKHKQNLLFQRFQQVMDDITQRQAGGTGLGLYISREFARIMNGDLVLTESDLGKGSTFTLTLPLADH